MRMAQPAEYLSFHPQLGNKVETLSVLVPFFDLLDSEHLAGGCVAGEVDASVRSSSQKITTNPFGGHCQKILGSTFSGLVIFTYVVYYPIVR